MKVAAGEYRTKTGQPVAVLTPEGRLDAAGAEPLALELRHQFDAGVTAIVVDFGETRYISSNGMRVLLSANKEAEGAGGAIRLVRLSPRLREIFEMAGFDQIFQVMDSVEAAVRSL